ncbi:MAG: sulfite dehydrogenase [Gammaproteobacteria bacterium]|nr:sulfite dehydrogenase [Gammaproteobacteria bacterium]
MQEQSLRPGRVIAASENKLSPQYEERRRLLGGIVGTAAALFGVRATAADKAVQRLAVPPWSKQLGKPVASQPYGLPSHYESNIIRRINPGLTTTSESSVAFTPLQNLFGIITPNGLHFERNHNGLPEVDPYRHRLVVHGLAKQSKIYTMEDILRFPSVSRVHFLECGANSAMEWAAVAAPTVQYTHGMLSCAEYTGVPLSTLLDDVGYDAKRAKFILAEGADAAGLTRTLPIEMALDDVLVVYGQNGEMLRPENGYPVRLIVPGVQGVSSVKWLRRIKIGDQPWHTREETIHYTDLMPDGSSRQYTYIQEAKSVITSPSGGQQLMDKGGYYQITGLAWSGRGRIKRVDVSTDGGRNWRPTRLQEPIMPKSLTRFRCDWSWDGAPTLLQSRCIDDTGYVQPTIRQLREVRGTHSIYHNNGIQTWQVTDSGDVRDVQV